MALARVLATRPKLVLLDEPLSALDAKLREELRLELKQILTAVGSTTIVVTHDQDEAMSLADRIIVMNRGRIEQQGSPDEIYMRPRTAFVAAFIGRANWFHGRISGEPGDGLFRLATDAGTKLAIRHPGPTGGDKGASASGRSGSRCRGPRPPPANPATIFCPARWSMSSTWARSSTTSSTAPKAALWWWSPTARARGPERRPMSLLFRAEDCLILPRSAG